jgi:hypothetical protein
VSEVANIDKHTSFYTVGLITAVKFFIVRASGTSMPRLPTPHQPPAPAKLLKGETASIVVYLRIVLRKGKKTGA